MCMLLYLFQIVYIFLYVILITFCIDCMVYILGMAEQLITSFGADTVVRGGLMSDGSYMEGILESLSPGVRSALQHAAESMLQNHHSDAVSPDAAFFTGAVLAIAIFRAEEVIASVEDTFASHDDSS